MQTLTDMATNNFLQAIENFGLNVFPGIQRLWNKWTGKSLTPAEQEANTFTANEAEKQRAWETEMSNTSYQRTVKDMQAAGINPAMAMSQGGASTPSGAAGSSVQPQDAMSMSDLMGLVLMPLQRKLLAAQAKQASDAGEAALMQGKAAMQNAKTNEGSLGVRQGELQSLRDRVGVEKFDAETRRMRFDLDKTLAASQISLQDQQIDLMAQQMAEIKLHMDYLPKQLAIAQQNADAATKHALAALQSAQAAVQNAATNDRKADYETSLMYAEESLKWAEGEGREIVNKYLDERQRQELDNLVKQGVHLDKENKLVDKMGHLVDARTAFTYVQMAATVNDAVYKWVNPLAGMSTPSMPSDWNMSSGYGPGTSVQMYGGVK